MKIKLRIDKDEEFDYSESDYTMPIIINRTMILGVYNVHFFEMTDNIWRQLPEEYKKKIYKYNWKKFIKNMVIIITDITAYSFNFNYNNKQKENIAMEEIYKNFDKNKEINCFITGCDFPNSSMSVYFQNLGEVYAEVELDDIVAISNKNTFNDYFVELEKEYNRKKNREQNLAKLEQIYNKQLIVKSLVDKNIDELSKEDVQKLLDNLMFGAYGVDLNMSEYIWYQLPEECKNKVYNYKEHTIKAMIITLTNISAYSVSISNHEKFKEAITMEEIYEDFSESKKIERFLCECDFPYSNMSVYFQNLGEIYAEFELEDWVYYEKEAKEEWKLKEIERRKKREIYKVEPEIIEGKVIKQTLLEKIRDEKPEFSSLVKKIFETEKLSKKDFKIIFLIYPLILRYLDLEFLIKFVKSAEELKIEIPENIKYDIGYWLISTEIEDKIEKEENLIKEIRDKLKLKKVLKKAYED